LHGLREGYQEKIKSNLFFILLNYNQLAKQQIYINGKVLVLE